MGSRYVQVRSVNVSMFRHNSGRQRHMNDEAFALFKEALEDVLAFERGERRDLKVTRIQAPALRKPSHLKTLPASDRMRRE